MIKEIIKLFEDLSLYGFEKMGLYYSQYRGWVAEVDEDFGRIKVAVPEVYGDQVPNIWAWPTSNYSGQDYGIQCLPRVNALIWVSFQSGNPKKPLWSHGYFTKNQIPVELKGKDKYWFRTPQGLTILINDKEGTITSFKKDGTIEPMILGDEWKALMEDLYNLLKDAKINTQMGPQGFLPNTLLALEQFKAGLNDALSKVNKLS